MRLCETHGFDQIVDVHCDEEPGWHGGEDSSIFDVWEHIEHALHFRRRLLLDDLAVLCSLSFGAKSDVLGQGVFDG